jgi:hypothetical protein
MDLGLLLRYDCIVRRPGLLDICAIVLFLVVLFLPARDLIVTGGFANAEAKDAESAIATIAKNQVALHADPGDGLATEEIADALSKLGRHDMSLRIAGRASTQPSASQWRSLYAISAAHADRSAHQKRGIEEFRQAFEYAKKALAKCQEKGQDCPAHEATRLSLWVKSLQAGLEAIERGVNPARSPEDFRKEMFSTHPRRVRTK